MVTLGQSASLAPTAHKAVGPSEGLTDGSCGGLVKGGLGAGIVGARVGRGLVVGPRSHPATKIPVQSILHLSPKSQHPMN